MVRLVPRETKFFDMFAEMTSNLMDGANVLKGLFQNYSDVPVAVQKIKDIEHKGDDMTHAVVIKLNQTFITPFDREDIHYLASALDDIADYIFASAKKINFYKVNPNDPGIQKMADLIEQAAEQIKNAVLELRDMKNMRAITDALVKVNSIENQADDIFDLSIDRLFETEPDAKEVIKKREIYQVMEIVTDKCEDAGNVIESIIIKYA